MNSKWMMAMLVTMLACGRVASAQTTPGTPLTIVGTDPNDASITTNFSASTVNAPINFNLPGNFTALTVTPGDLVVLTNPTGGDAKSNWAAVVQFDNPGDPTGTLDLPATDSQAFFPSTTADFTTLTLFPTVQFITTGGFAIPMEVVANFNEFGPNGAFLVGQEDTTVFTLFLPTVTPSDKWNGTGNWVNTPANWSTGVPTSTTDATIQSGTVTVSTGGTQAEAMDTDNFAKVNIASGGILTTPTFENETGATLDIEAGGSLVMSGAFTQHGGSTLVLGNAIDFTPGSFVLSGATATAATVTVSGTDTATIGTVIADNASENDILLKTGTGTLILNQTNTYSGGTTISAGTIEALANNAVGTGNITVSSGASLQLSGQILLVNNVTITGTGAGGVGALYSTDNNLNEVSGTITLAGNATVSSAAFAQPLLLAGDVSLGSHTLTLDGGGYTQLDGQITGTGGFTVDNGIGLLTGTASNTYTGLTTVAANGVLDLGKTVGLASVSGNLSIAGALEDYVSGQIASTSVVTLSGTGQFSFRNQGVTETIAGLNASSNGTQISPYLNGGGDTLVIAGSGTYVYSGFINDNLHASSVFTNMSVAMHGTGSQEFDSANGYSGGTTLSNGTLVAGNASAFGTGEFDLNSGTLKMGNGIHALTLTSYHQTGGTLLLNLAGTGHAATPDQLDITNTSVNHATLGGNLTVNLAQFTPLTPVHGSTITYTFTLVDTDNGYNGTFASFDPLHLANGLTASLDYATTPDDVLLQIIQAAAPNAYALTGLTANQQAILAPINVAVGAGDNGRGFTKLNNALTPFTTSPSAFGGALSQLSPQAFGQFASATAFNNASFETQAKDSYAASQRGGPNGTFVGGNGNIDASGLTMNDPSYDPNLAMVHSRLLAWNAAPISNGLLSDSADAVLGGTEMKDTKEMMAQAKTDPWNFFVRGNVILAQGFSSQDVSHFDDNTESVVIGADYRLTPNFLVGLTAGYAHTDVTLDNNGSSATVDSYSPGIYASYADKGWYANFSGDYVHNSYTQSRVIGFLSQTANSAPEGDEGVVNLDGGYDFRKGALTFGPLAGLQYTHLTVNGYSETGSVADLSVNEEDADSLRSRLGGRVSYAFAHCGMTFTPYLNASWQHEFLDQSRGISSSFQGAGLGSFSVRTDNPSRDSALLDAGFDAEINRTMTLFTDYIVQVGQENYFGQSVQAGMKIGF